MKPLHLAFNGLRSYVAPQSIDFTGKQFIAVLGDTGAGKSTILDAICYALYNRCSWASGTVTDLIAHGGDGTLSVAFTFHAGGQTWLVERSTSGNNAAPVHKLTAAGTGTVTATGSTNVSTAIRRILGLTYDTFLRSVILPQNRFQELLRMGKSERSSTLKSLLGLDQLTAVREHAITLHTRLAPRLADYREHRATFLPDPAATISAASQRQSTAQKRLDQLQAAQRDIARARQIAVQASIRREKFNTTRDRLNDAVPPNVHGRYQDILAAATDIASRREPLNTQHHQVEVEYQRLQDALDTADRDGTGVAATATALRTLTDLTEQVPALDVLAERVKRDRAEVNAGKAYLDAAQSRVSERLEAVTTAAAALTTAKERAEAADQAHQNAATALQRYRQAVETTRLARQQHTTVRQEITNFKTLAGAAASTARAAEDAVADAENNHNAAQRLHAAAIAGDGCHPGDDCPVCHQSIPDGYVAPSDDTTKATAATLRAARKTATQAGKDEATAAERVTNAEQRTLTEAGQAVTLADADLERAAADLCALIGDADIGRPDEQILRPLADAAQAAKLAHGGEATADREARDAHAAAKAEIPVLEEAQTKREAALRELEEDHDSTLVALNRRAKMISRAFRPAHGLPLDEITDLRKRAEQRTAELKNVSEAHGAVGATLKQHAAALKQLEDEYTQRVTGPAGDLRGELAIVADRAADAEKLLASVIAYPVRPDGQALAEEVEWSIKLIAYAADLATGCAGNATAEDDAAQAAQQEAQRLRLVCHADSDEHLEQLIREASTTEHNARRELDRATTQQPIVTELERRITTAAPTVAALADLSSLLTDGKFIANAVRQRQTALLAAASDTLLTISGGKFGFGENFQIIDTDTGRGRDVKTLSGGETFQASLALALAVVELASRAAGRVDSLFLDEGFGSLDAGVLQDALNALAAHSNDGRVVTIISHMRTIAEITDHVLVVEKTFTGSRCHWASPDERDRIVNDDLNRGLLE